MELMELYEYPNGIRNYRWLKYRVVDGKTTLSQAKRLVADLRKILKEVDSLIWRFEARESEAMRVANDASDAITQLRKSGLSEEALRVAKQAVAQVVALAWDRADEIERILRGKREKMDYLYSEAIKAERLFGSGDDELGDF